MSVMIETQNLCKTFGSITAVDDLSFSVAKGELLGFLGPNGAGKSTTMKILTCFLAPNSGTARVCGHDVFDQPMEVRRSVGYLPENAPAYSEMSVVSFLKFVGRIRGFSGGELEKAVDAIIEKCSLTDVRHQQFDTLSKGYKRRVGLAQALIHDPQVLILDEPTDGLDPNQKREVRNLISEMASDKVIVISTHILEEVDAICTRAIIIAHGRLVADGTPEELKQKSRYHGAVTMTIRDGDIDSIKAAVRGIGNVDAIDVLSDGDDKLKRFRVFPKRGKSIASDVSQLSREKHWNLDELHVEQGRLDEVFRDLTLKTEKSE